MLRLSLLFVCVELELLVPIELEPLVVVIHLFLFFHLFTSCALSHDPQSVSLSIAVQCLTYNTCRTLWNYLHEDSMECLIANTCSPTSIYSQ